LNPKANRDTAAQILFETFIATASYPTLHIHSPQIENHNLVFTAPPRTTSPSTVTRSDIGSIRQR
jgi:hypothetical protein